MLIFMNQLQVVKIKIYMKTENLRNHDSTMRCINNYLVTQSYRKMFQ